MAWEIPGLKVSLPAKTDLTAYQFAAVDLVNNAGEANVQLPSASGDAAIGFLQNNPDIGEAAELMLSGITKANAVETITVGQKLMCTPTGGLGVATSSKYAIARALEGAALGQTFTVLIERNGKV